MKGYKEPSTLIYQQEYSRLPSQPPKHILKPWSLVCSRKPEWVKYISQKGSGIKWDGGERQVPHHLGFVVRVKNFDFIWVQWKAIRGFKAGMGMRWGVSLLFSIKYHTAAMWRMALKCLRKEVEKLL